MLRDSALKIIRALEIEGGCNVQFALDPHSFQYYLIEVNPRVSRSSALASKASGYPIARVSAKIAVGHDAGRDPTRQHAGRALNRRLDYVVTKMPRFPFDKFTDARQHARHPDEGDRRGDERRPHAWRKACSRPSARWRSALWHLHMPQIRRHAGRRAARLYPQGYGRPPLRHRRSFSGWGPDVDADLRKPPHIDRFFLNKRRTASYRWKTRCGESAGDAAGACMRRSGWASATRRSRACGADGGIRGVRAAPPARHPSRSTR